MYATVIPLADINKEAKRILEAAEERGVLLRLIGGLAIRLHCPSATHKLLKRSYPDVDFIGLYEQEKMIIKLFKELGYVENKQFNLLHKGRRLQFGDEVNRRVIDVFLDKFEMCHKLDLRKRLKISKFSIPLSDLFLTKLQIVQLNEKDVKDVITLLKDHELGEVDADEIINIDYIAKVCSQDWGWHKTVTTNLDKILQLIPSYTLGKDVERDIIDKINHIKSRIEDAPKSIKWKVRSFIGARMRWWTPVEDVVR